MVGSFPKLRTKASVSSTSAITTSAPRSQSQQYPPDTPDRPAPLTVSKTTPSLKVGTSRSVSTPSRTRFVTPLSPDGQSPPPQLPSSYSPSHYTPSSRSKSSSKLKLSYIPPRYATKPADANADPFMSKDNDSATYVGSFTTGASKSPDDATPTVEYPLSTSAASSVYSDTHEPKWYSIIEGATGTELRQDTPSIEDSVTATLQHSREPANSDADWTTTAEEDSELDVTRHPNSFYDSDGFLIEDHATQEEGVSQERVVNSVALLTCGLEKNVNILESFPGVPSRAPPRSSFPPRVDSLPKLPASRIPVRKVTPAQRAAAWQASREAREANLAAMSTSSR
jgi:hypothetical protein